MKVLGLLRRYFAESAAMLACMVFGVRDCVTADGVCTRDYWITDGMLFATDLPGIGVTHGASAQVTIHKYAELHNSFIIPGSGSGCRDGCWTHALLLICWASLTCAQ